MSYKSPPARDYKMIVSNAKTLTSHGNIDGRVKLLEILEAGFEASDPYNNTTKLIKLDEDKLTVGHRDFEWSTADRKVEGREPIVFELSKIGNIYVVGGGKAAQRMANAVEDVLGDLVTEGQINAKKGEKLLLKRINVTFAGHPMPDKDSVEGSQRIVEVMRKAKKGDIVFYCNSGGASALTALPGPGLTLEDLTEVNRLLYFERGASMPETNAVRTTCLTILNTKHLRYVHDAACIYLLTSETPPDPRPIDPRRARRPTNIDPYRYAIDMLKKYGIWGDIPESVRRYLEKADPQYGPTRPEEVEDKPFYDFTVMDPTYMLEASTARAGELGLTAAVTASSLNDIDVKPVAETMSYVAHEIETRGQPVKPPCVLISGGELTVAVGKATGLGGRNQEFVLWSAPMIAGSKRIVVASADSDGTDGPTSVAGGVVDGSTMDRIGEAGINLFDELENHNSLRVMERLDDAIVTGARGTNVRDLRLIYVSQHEK